MKSRFFLLSLLVVFNGAPLGAEEAGEAKQCFALVGSDARAAVTQCAAEIAAAQGDKSRLAELYYARGSAHWRLGRRDSAFEDYAAAETANAGASPVLAVLILRSRGHAHRQLRQWKEAEENFTKAIAHLEAGAESKVKSDEALDTYLSRGWARQNLKKYDSAIGDYLKSLSYSTESEGFIFNANNNLATIYSEKRQFDKARRHFANIEEMGRDKADFFNNRGAMEQKAGNHRAAFSDFSEAVRLEPENGSRYLQRGWAYACLKNKSAAARDMQKAFKLSPALVAGEQALLKSAGYLSGRIDGQFGPATRRALMEAWSISCR